MNAAEPSAPSKLGLIIGFSSISFGIELEIQGKEWLVDKINDAMGYKLPEEGNTEMSKYDNKTIQELKKTVLDLSEVIDITEEEDAEDAE